MEKELADLESKFNDATITIGELVDKVYAVTHVYGLRGSDRVQQSETFLRRVLLNEQ